MSRRNRFLNWSFGPAFESRYCCERCPSFSVKSEFPGHHVCSVMMRGWPESCYVDPIGQDWAGGWDLKFKNDV